MSTPRSLPLLLRVAHGVRKRHEGVCAAHGLTFQQFNVLRILAGEEARGGEGLPTMTIRERLLEPGPGITRFVRQLRDRGWVVTASAPADRRQQIVRLTTAGRTKLQELEGPIRNLAAAILQPLTEAEHAQLRHLLHELT